MHRQSAQIGATNRQRKNVGFLLPISASFVTPRCLRLDSAKTYENPVRETACRKTDDFPVSVAAALIGRLMAIREMA
jgi:hypothetical protein